MARLTADCASAGTVVRRVSKSANDLPDQVVLHYDAEFEHIAATTGQPHKWIVPQGTLD
jgi:hypothetical protein